MRTYRFISGPIWIGLALSISSFFLYFLTLAPTLSWGWHENGADGGELLVAAKTLGIPHPPGYPTYTLLLKCFASIFPFGDYAYRGNLLSALLAAISIFLLYLIILRLCLWIKPDTPIWLSISSSALGGVAFGTTPLLWSKAVITEVYTLNVFFSSMLILIASHVAIHLPADRNRTEPQHGKLALFGLVLGIGLGNHLTLLAVAAPLFYWLWTALGWKRLASPWMISTLILGTAIYLYLPIRANQHPPVNWGNADTINGIVWMLTARPYQDYVFGISLGTIPTRLASYLELVFSQFNPLGLFFGLVGGRALILKGRHYFLATFTSITVLSVYSVNYNTMDFEVLMLPALLLFSIWIGFGFYWITSSWIEAMAGSNGLHLLMKKIHLSTDRQMVIITILAFSLLPAVSVAINYGTQDLSNDYRARDHVRLIQSEVSDGAVVLSKAEKTVFSLWYVRYVEKPEWDVAVIAVPLLQFDWYLRDIHRMFPDRIPLMPASDLQDTISKIIEHNKPSTKVFLTFKNQILTKSFNLTQENGGIVYLASSK